jgi:HEAT repeat protein
MAGRLLTLMKTTNDLYLIDYVLQNLGKGVEPDRLMALRFRDIRDAALRKKLYLTWLPLARVHLDLQQQELSRVYSEQMAVRREKLQALRHLSAAQLDDLKNSLKHENATVRLEAVTVAALKRPPVESELIDLLNDPQPLVRESAHQALVRVARGTDFGPLPTATPAEHTRAVRAWRNWLALQDSAAAVQDYPPPTPALAVRPEADDEAARLSKEFVRVAAAEQERLLRQLKDGKGVVYTEALAQAIPQLAEPLQGKARDALAERLTRMNADTLRDKLEDDSREVRRAAALACAMKESKAHIPDLIARLDDREPAVAQAARTALRSLTGQDFPTAAAWRAWWQKQKDR